MGFRVTSYIRQLGTDNERLAGQPSSLGKTGAVLQSRHRQTSMEDIRSPTQRQKLWSASIQMAARDRVGFTWARLPPV